LELGPLLKGKRMEIKSVRMSKIKLGFERGIANIMGYESKISLKQLSYFSTVF
jgi:hypothetical protein